MNNDILLHVPDGITMKSAGLSKKGRDKWTGATKIHINGVEYHLMLTLVPTGAPTGSPVKGLESFTKEQIEEMKKLYMTSRK